MDNRFKLRSFFEWGGNFLWPDTTDQKAFERFDVDPIAPEDLVVSAQLCEELQVLEKSGRLH